MSTQSSVLEDPFPSRHKNSMAHNSVGPVASAAVNMLAITRIVVGCSSIFLPNHATPFFGIPLTAQTALTAQVFGNREIALGGLLWHAKNQHKGDGTTGGTPETRRNLRRVLWTGFVVDTLDVFCSMFNLFGGTISNRAMFWYGGGAASLVALATLALRGV